MFRNIMKYISSRVNIHCKDMEKAKKNLALVLSKEGSILDKYGFIQGTDKASANVGGGTFHGHLSLTHDYLRHYDFLFHSFRNEKFNLIEFGCLGGSSLRTWKQYFPNVEIYGVDLDENTKGLEEERIHIVIGNAVAKTTFDELKNKTGSAFIILDDASHAWSDQRRSFELFWDLVSPGGFYVIEDLECGTSGAYLEYPPEVLDSQPFCDYMHDRSKILRWAPDRRPVENSYHFDHLPGHVQKIEREMDMCTFIPGAVIVRKKQ